MDCSQVRHRTVYPRVCGGTAYPQRAPQHPAGLSPRVRGNLWLLTLPPAMIGLSPRVRGNLRYLFRQLDNMGSIPACAGEPHDLAAGAWGMQVYPRVCGGTASLCALPMEHAGSIPACAGEPRPAFGFVAVVLVYPRVCGGTSLVGPGADEAMGLSPRVRGNRTYFQKGRPCIRFYPRVCGGTSSALETSTIAKGLSPRVRGNPTGFALANIWQRSIPACAGEPQRGKAGCASRAVYPRVCGGTACPPVHHWSSGGLSPRVRGNQSRT